MMVYSKFLVNLLVIELEMVIPDIFIIDSSSICPSVQGPSLFFADVNNELAEFCQHLIRRTHKVARNLIFGRGTFLTHLKVLLHF